MWFPPCMFACDSHTNRRSRTLLPDVPQICSVLPLRPILRLRLLLRLPLHVARVVSSALAQWDDVVNHVARSPVRVAGLALKLLLRNGTALWCEGLRYAWVRWVEYERCCPPEELRGCEAPAGTARRSSIVARKASASRVRGMTTSKDQGLPAYRSIAIFFADDAPFGYVIR